MYKNAGDLSTFYSLKPVLTKKQTLLLSAFYKLSQERVVNQGAPYPIKEIEIRYYQEYYGSHLYAPDLFIIAIRAIDSEYIKTRCEQMRRESKKG